LKCTSIGGCLGVWRMGAKPRFLDDRLVER